MTRILILEGNTPELALDARRTTGRTAAEGYAETLAELAEVETVIAEPYFSDHDPDALEMESFAAMAVTGSGVEWSAADERARPFWTLYERAFAAGIPVFGSCWGLQNGAVVLGGDTATGPNGVEAGVARAVTPRDHPMHKGRRQGFDVAAMHRDDVTRIPEGAVVTASNEHTHVQAMAYDRDGVSFWGVQYHPECDLRDIGFWLKRGGDAWPGDARRAGDEIARIAEDPAFYAGLCAKHRIGIDLLDRSYHRTELRNWLTERVGAPLR